MSYNDGDGDLWFEHFSENIHKHDPEFGMASLFYLQDIRNLLKLILKELKRKGGS